jgi:putative ABC transport system substrate-binding protein
MRRREFITLLGSAAVAWPFAAHGQPSKPVIGFLRNTSPEESAYLLTALRKGLNEAGYVEGANLAIEYRWGGGHQDQLRDLADDLIRHNVSLIIGGGDAAIIATRAATATLPIVKSWRESFQSCCHAEIGAAKASARGRAPEMSRKVLL